MQDYQKELCDKNEHKEGLYEKFEKIYVDNNRNNYKRIRYTFICTIWNIHRNAINYTNSTVDFNDYSMYRGQRITYFISNSFADINLVIWNNYLYDGFSIFKRTYVVNTEQKIRFFLTMLKEELRREEYQPLVEELNKYEKYTERKMVKKKALVVFSKNEQEITEIFMNQ